MAAPRGMPAGRGYSRSRGREAPAEMANGGPEGNCPARGPGRGPSWAGVRPTCAHALSTATPLNGPSAAGGALQGFEGAGQEGGTWGR